MISYIIIDNEKNGREENLIGKNEYYCTPIFSAHQLLMLQTSIPLKGHHHKKSRRLLSREDTRYPSDFHERLTRFVIEIPEFT